MTLQTLARDEVLITGPAGTGKSRACLEKLNRLCWQYPGARCLIVRKTRESLTESALVTFEQKVAGSDPRLKPVVAGAMRNTRHSYRYPNGSEIIIGGLRTSGKDTTEKVMSTEYDVIYVQEAIELHETEWERLTTRARNGVMPEQQIIADCNPAGPMHWLWKRYQAGKTAYLESRHEDNPLLWDDGAWTEYGATYLAKLDALTGALHDRLRLGKWVQAEGVVYDNFGVDNLTDDDPDPDRAFEIAFDDGFVDPRAILFIQRTPQRILVFDELYHRKHLEETCVSEVIELCGKWFGWRWLDAEGREVEPPADEATALATNWSKHPRRLPDIAVGSHEALQLQKRFRSANIPARSALHKVVEGIKVVRSLICDGNGERSLAVNRRCKYFIDEITSGYQYPPESTRRNEEDPLYENNHAADAIRMWSWLRARG